MNQVNSKVLFNEVKKTKLYEGRNVVLISKVGSVNYNLHDKLSDEDYKVYVLPTKEDLYNGTRVSTSFTGDIDFAVHDVRDLVKQLKCANVNYVEVLFSVEHHVYAPEMEVLLSMKEEIASMNLPYLFGAGFGMMSNKRKTLLVGTKGTSNLVSKYGYCTKSFMTAYRGLDFLLRYHANGFASFEKAVRYEYAEREELLLKKYGAFSYKEADALLLEMESKVQQLKEAYKIHEFNQEAFYKLDNLVKDLVFEEI